MYVLHNTELRIMHKLQGCRSRLEMQVACKSNAGPSISGTSSSTDFVSQNYLRIQNYILKTLNNLRSNIIFNIEIVKIIPLSIYD